MRVRREPPRWRTVELVGRVEKRPRLVRLTLRGDELDADLTREPAASVRLLLPTVDGELVVPAWNGNEFLLPDGRRPTIRTLTPLRAGDDGDGDGGEGRVLAVEVVVHDDSPLSRWATTAAIGTPAALSGPGRGYTIDDDATAFVLAGDESARPAIDQLRPLLPAAADVETVVLDDPDALPDAVAALTIPVGARVWAAGEAAAMQRLRKHLFDERGLARSQCTVRGYWKRGRAGTGDDA